MNKIKEILMKYRGKLEEESDRLALTNPNTIADWKGRKRTVPCEIKVRTYMDDGVKKYSVSLEEKTLAILGGSSCGHMDEDEAIQRVRFGLKRYCFEKKQYEQLTLF